MIADTGSSNVDNLSTKRIDQAETGLSHESQSGGKPLNLAVISDNRQLPEWLCRAIELLIDSGEARVTGRGAFFPRIQQRRGAAESLTSAIRAIDARIFGQDPDPLIRRKVRSPESSTLTPDVFLVLDDTEIDELPLNTRIWTIEYGQDGSHDPDVAAQNAVVNGESWIEMRLIERSTDGSASILASSVTGTAPFSIRRTRDRMLWTGVNLLLRAVRQQRNRKPVPTTSVVQPHFALSTLKWARFGSRLLRTLVDRGLKETQWILAYSFTDDNIDVRDIDEQLIESFTVAGPTDRFWADPFVVSHQGRRWLFVEEWPKGAPRAHVSALEIQRDGTLGDPVRVLERPYHLSYPHVFEWNDDLYMIPETSENRTVELYKCHQFPEDWRLERVLLEDLRAVDATVTEIDGRWWMFTSIAPEHGVENDQLFLYFADSPLGPWHPHPMNPVVSDVRRARMAGNLFRDHEGWIRPAQDCSIRYGYSMSFNRIRTLTLDQFEEEEVTTILPTWAHGINGTHTFNCAAGITVVDGARSRYRL